ncbi:MAG: hypothetical protein ACPL88_03140, partial [Bryobacteraceae bacterium]
MAKELVISSNRHETKVAVLEDEQLVEIHFQRANEYSLAGSIHKGRVTRVLPGMQSAFVDIGLERDAFLYVSDFLEETEEYDRIPVRTAERPAAQPEASEAAERRDRRLRRSRRRRPRPHALPESKYASRAEETERAAEFAILPGESLAKYRDLLATRAGEAAGGAGEFSAAQPETSEAAAESTAPLPEELELAPAEPGEVPVPADEEIRQVEEAAARVGADLRSGLIEQNLAEVEGEREGEEREAAEEVTGQEEAVEEEEAEEEGVEEEVEELAGEEPAEEFEEEAAEESLEVCTGFEPAAAEGLREEVIAGEIESPVCAESDALHAQGGSAAAIEAAESESEAAGLAVAESEAAAPQEDVEAEPQELTEQ